MITHTANPSALPDLPAWPFERFATDASLDKVVRVSMVERALLAEFGAVHVPDTQGSERYFAREIDAKYQRRHMARRIVDEQDWRTRYAQIASQGHGFALPTMREIAEAQRAEFEAVGEVTTTGYERLDVITRGVA